MSIEGDFRGNDSYQSEQLGMRQLQQLTDQAEGRPASIIMSTGEKQSGHHPQQPIPPLLNCFYVCWGMLGVGRGFAVDVCSILIVQCDVVVTPVGEAARLFDMSVPEMVSKYL